MAFSSKLQPRLCRFFIFFRHFGRASLFALVAGLTLLSSLHESKVPFGKLKSLPEESYPYQCPSTRYSPVYNFLHLHKTAGNSLKRSLFAFATRNNLTIFHTCHTDESRHTLLGVFSLTKNSGSLNCNLDVLSALPAQNRSAINVIVGHQTHGVHSLFYPRPVRYFTFVRHPIFRKTSHFYHFEPPNASLTEYLLTRNRNYMTKRLSPREPISELSLQIRSRILDVDPFALNAALGAASSHLISNFFFVGLHDRHAESLCILSRILNRACRTGTRDSGLTARLAHSFPLDPHRLTLEVENIRGHTNKAVQRLPQSVLRKALHAEAADVTLYHFAEQLFESKLSHYPECRLAATPASVAWQHVLSATN